MKKRWFAVLFAALLALTVGMVGCATDAAGEGRGRNLIARPGTYITETPGWFDTIVVETQLSSSRILSVRVLEHRETLGIGTIPVALMPERIVSAQSVAVDVVTGGTITSMAIRNAVMDALEEAGANMEVFTARPPRLPPVDRTITADVVVVGAGGAGLTAAIAAQNELIRITGDQTRRRNVVLIEKFDTPGGNTIRSLGTWYSSAAAAPGQEAAHINARINSGMESGHWLSIRDQLEYMIRHSAQIAHWLRENRIIGTVVVPPIHEQTCAKGKIMGMQNRFVQQQGRLMYGVEATRILTNAQGHAIGIEAIDRRNGGTITINAKAVVLATGGFGYNLEKIVELNPKYKGYITNNTSGAMGDGIWMAEAIGAKTIHMDWIQAAPTVYPGNTLILEWQRAHGGILLNNEGRRFVNEAGFRDDVADAIMAQGGSAVCLFSRGAFGGDAQMLYEMGVIRPLTTHRAIADYVGTSEANIRETLQKWNTLITTYPTQPARRDNDWIQPGTSGRLTADLSQGPWFALRIQPGIHFTMGGVAADIYTRVLRDNANFRLEEIPGRNVNAAGTVFNRDGIRISGDPIPGLFAAGEVVGGIHGGNREGANALVENQIFGRVAGFNAARFVHNLPVACPFVP